MRRENDAQETESTGGGRGGGLESSTSRPRARGDGAHRPSYPRFGRGSAPSKLKLEPEQTEAAPAAHAAAGESGSGATCTPPAKLSSELAALLSLAKQNHEAERLLHEVMMTARLPSHKYFKRTALPPS